MIWWKTEKPCGMQGNSAATWVSPVQSRTSKIPGPGSQQHLSTFITTGNAFTDVKPYREVCPLENHHVRKKFANMVACGLNPLHTLCLLWACLVFLIFEKVE